MSCLKGHVFCKECIFQCLLTQKSRIAREEKQYAKAEEAKKRNDEKTKELEKAAQLEAFNRSECGAIGFTNIMKRDGSGEVRDLSPAEWAQLTETQREFVRAKKGDKEYKGVSGNLKMGVSWDVGGSVVGNNAKGGEGLKSTNFWVTGNTPECAPKALEKPVTEMMCPEGDHPVRLKTLVPLKFSVLRNVDKVDPLYVHNCRHQCPSCMRTLTNAGYNCFFKKCGHVLCKACVEKVCLPDGKCFVCNADVDRRQVVEMQAGGTGFAAHDKDRLMSQTFKPKAIV